MSFKAMKTTVCAGLCLMGMISATVMEKGNYQNPAYRN